MKDSFCQVDPEAANLTELFGASWIWRDARNAETPTQWERVGSVADLKMWEAVWKRNGSPTDVRMFNESFLARNDIFIFGQRRHGAFVSGCIGNISRDCIGISNIFSEALSDQVFSEATSAVCNIAPDLPVVGYEADASLDAMCRIGFEAVGNLRILISENEL